MQLLNVELQVRGSDIEDVFLGVQDEEPTEKHKTKLRVVRILETQVLKHGERTSTGKWSARLRRIEAEHFQGRRSMANGQRWHAPIGTDGSRGVTHFGVCVWFAKEKKHGQEDDSINKEAVVEMAMGASDDKETSFHRQAVIDLALRHRNMELRVDMTAARNLQGHA